MHFTTEEFIVVADEWFGAEVERLWRARWSALQALERSRVEDEAAAVAGGPELAQPIPGGSGGPGSVDRP